MNEEANQVYKQGMELGSRLITDVLSWVHQRREIIFMRAREKRN